MNDKIIQDRFPDRNYTRLTGYDYSTPGAYFVTICAHKKQCLFGNIETGVMRVNQYGEIIQKCWEDLPKHYTGINNQIFTVMPNHVHGIIVINAADRRSSSYISYKLSTCGCGLRKLDPTKKYPLPEIIRAFKTYSSKGINELRYSPGTMVWQRSYYEHIIRNENDMREIGEYIVYNPAQWNTDDENPNLLTK